MNLSTRFAVAIHVLTLLAYDRSGPMSSELIASSVNTSAVVMRRTLGLLRAAKFVDSRSGPGGGWRLLRAPEAITLRDVYRAVEGGPLFPLHASPNPRCPVGGRVGGVLAQRFESARQALEAELGGATVADMLRAIARPA